MKKYFALLYTFALLHLPAFAQTSNGTDKTDSNFHLYILMGQSNMAGRGEITAEFAREGHPRVYMLNKNNQWVPARHPLHFDKPIAGVGPGLAFAIGMADKNPDVKIGIIPCAVGGTAIRYWKPGAYDSATKTYPYDQAVARIRIAMESGVVKGMLWHQGEADSEPGKAEVYLKAFAVLVDSIRSVTHNTHLPVVAGELGRFRPVFQNINMQLKQLPGAIAYTAVASSEGLTDKGDSTHFTSAAAETLGRRYAEKMIWLQSRDAAGKRKHKPVMH